LYKRGNIILIWIISTISILYIIFSLIIIDRIKPINELSFYKQFFMFSILYLIILPIIIILISNLYLKIINKKEWFSWFKLPEYYDSIFIIITLLIYIFSMFELVVYFVLYYSKLIMIYKLSVIILALILCMLGGIKYKSVKDIIRKIFMIK
jgi:hypothetical protein